MSFEFGDAQLKRCFQFLRCQNTDCKLHGVMRGPQCWEAPETLCISHERQKLADKKGKLAICQKCVYLHYAEVFRQFGRG